MIHDNPLSKVVERHGLVTMAQAIGVSYQAVQRYIKERVPSDKVIALCSFDDWQVTPHDLRPDIYPHADDGLPSDMRCVCEDKEA
jgi:DNA-binding transcriptional regulator YdaS (Cro superfamily)